MATFLDASLLEKFDILFPFLLSFAFVYGILTYTRVFHESRGIQALIAFVLAIFTLFSPIVREVINTMAPWFVLLFIFVIFMLIGVKVLGQTDADINAAIHGKYSYVVVWMVALVVIIGVGSFASVTFSEGRPIGVNSTDNLETSTDEESEGQEAFFNVLFHPKVLGLALILLISYFTISRLGGDFSG